jgi:hypothetical protein
MLRSPQLVGLASSGDATPQAKWQWEHCLVDDEDNKVRRNLVAASVLTILAAWLDIPLVKIAFKLIDADASSAQEWKILAAGLAAFVYMLMRFRFSTEGFAYVQSVRDEYQKSLYLKSGWLVEYYSRKFIRGGSEHAIFGGGLSAAMRDVRKCFAEEHPDEKSSQISSLKVRVSARGTDTWDFSIEVTSWVQVLGRASSSREFAPFKLRPPGEIFEKLVEVWAWAHTLSFSEASVRNVFPVWMATVAICIFLWRIGLAYTSL